MVFGLIGEYVCKLDDKGRLSIPSKLRTQWPETAGNQLVINRGFDQCLVIYTKEHWLQEMEKLNAVDDFMSPEIRRFKRLFTNGANLVQMDGAQRINIPKKLLEYAAIHQDVVLSANGNKVEIWALDIYNNEMAVKPEELSNLAIQFMQQKPKI